MEARGLWDFFYAYHTVAFCGTNQMFHFFFLLMLVGSFQKGVMRC